MSARGEENIMAIHRGELPVVAVYRGETVVWEADSGESDTFRGICGTALYLEKPDGFEQEVEDMYGAPYDEILEMFIGELGMTREETEKYFVYMTVGGSEPPHVFVNGVQRWLQVQPDGSFSLQITESVTSIEAGNSRGDGNPLYSLELILNTSGMTNADTAFAGGSELTTIDMSKCDISAVTSMTGMFMACRSLVDLRMKGFGRQSGLRAERMLTGSALSHESLVYTFLTHSYNRRAAGFPDIDLSEVIGAGVANPFTTSETAALAAKGYVWNG